MRESNILAPIRIFQKINQLKKILHIFQKRIIKILELIFELIVKYFIKMYHIFSINKSVLYMINFSIKKKAKLVLYYIRLNRQIDHIDLKSLSHINQSNDSLFLLRVQRKRKTFTF
jgi:hypothetical protein